MLQRSVSDRVFHALADPTRRTIIERLGEGPLSVSALAEPLRVTLTAVVQHIRVLEDAGLVRTSKAGRVRSCEIREEGFMVAADWIGRRKQERATLSDRRVPARAYDPSED
jgi:DNA-binding transcriptional ArsR family regulator